MSSAKVPPRFVPTLTDVVQGQSGGPSDAAEPPEQAADEPEPEAAAAQMPAPPSWAREGMLSPRRGVVTLPASLPPLPPLPGLAAPVQPDPDPGEAVQPQDPVQEATPEIEAAQAAGDAQTAEFQAWLAPAVPATEPQPPVPVSGESQLPSPSSSHLPASGPADEVPAEALDPPPAQAAPSVSQAMDGLWEVHAQKVTEEYLVHRLMQRVDLVLDQRLREAIATVVQEQTRSIVVRLREEVESVVRQAVYEAVADELAQQARAVDPGARGA